MARKTMTFGHFPSYEEFEQAFEAECPFGFRIEHGSPGHAVAAGIYSCNELWEELHELVLLDQEDRWFGPEDKGPRAWADSIMARLGFEWV